MPDIFFCFDISSSDNQHLNIETVVPLNKSSRNQIIQITWLKFNEWIIKFQFKVYLKHEDLYIFIVVLKELKSFSFKITDKAIWNAHSSIKSAAKLVLEIGKLKAIFGICYTITSEYRFMGFLIIDMEILRNLSVLFLHQLSAHRNQSDEHIFHVLKWSIWKF